MSKNKTPLILDPDLEEIDDRLWPLDEGKPPPDESESIGHQEVVARILEDAASGQSTIDRISAFLTVVLASDPRLPPAEFSIAVLPDGEGANDTGLGISFTGLEEDLEKIEDEQALRAIDAAEERAIRLLLALSPEAFGLRQLLEDHPDGVVLGRDRIPEISNHERLALVNDLVALLAPPLGDSAARLVIQIGGPTARRRGEHDMMSLKDFEATCERVCAVVRASLLTDPNFCGGLIRLSLFGDGTTARLTSDPKQGGWDAVCDRAFQRCTDLIGDGWEEIYMRTLPRATRASVEIMTKDLSHPSNHQRMAARAELKRLSEARGQNLESNPSTNG